MTEQPDQLLFQTLYKQHQRMVLTLCRGFMKGNLDLANDLLQDVFINVWSALPSFRGQASYKTWIYRITINTCLLQLRREKRRSEVLLNEMIHDREEEFPSDQEQKLYEAIGALEEVDRLVIMLVLEEVPYPDIAEMLGISENNLRVKIHRARTKLKSRLQNGE